MLKHHVTVLNARRIRRRQKSFSRPVFLRQPRLHLPHIVVESSNRSWSWRFGHRNRSRQKRASTLQQLPIWRNKLVSSFAPYPFDDCRAMHAASFEGESFSPRKMLQLVHFGEILICLDHVSAQISIGYTCRKI